MRFPLLFAAACVALLAGAPLQARDTARRKPIPAHGVIGVEEQHLSRSSGSAAWRRPTGGDRQRRDRRAERAPARTDPTIHDLRALPATLARAQVAGVDRSAVAAARTPRSTTWTACRCPTRRSTALVAELRSPRSRKRSPPATAWWCIAPTCARSRPRCACSAAAANTDIDRFQESALFPGTPVVIAHESRDGDWWFVVSPRYAAWIEKRHVAEGSAADVFGYAARRPYRVVTGATRAHRVHAGAAAASPNCSWTWACACRCWPTGRPTSRSTASIPTPRT